MVQSIIASDDGGLHMCSCACWWTAWNRVMAEMKWWCIAMQAYGAF